MPCPFWLFLLLTLLFLQKCFRVGFDLLLLMLLLKKLNILFRKKMKVEIGLLLKMIMMS